MLRASAHFADSGARLYDGPELAAVFFFDCLQPGLLQRRAVVVEVCVSTQDPCLYIESICRIDFVCREWPWVRQGTLRVVAGVVVPLFIFILSIYTERSKNSYKTFFVKLTNKLQYKSKV